MHPMTPNAPIWLHRALQLHVAALAVLLSCETASADARVRARLQPEQVSLGQTARLEVTVSDSQGASAPRVPAVEGLSVRGIGQTMSMQIVGGQISSEVTHNFLIQPTRSGSFTIPALTVNAAGEMLGCFVGAGGKRRGSLDHRRGEAASLVGRKAELCRGFGKGLEKAEQEGGTGGLQ